MLNDYVIAHIRTLVPLAVGSALTWLATSLHLVVDPSSQAGLVALCTAVLSAAYYSLAKLAEAKFPQLGWLLGKAAEPSYSTATQADLDDVPDGPEPDDMDGIAGPITTAHIANDAIAQHAAPLVTGTAAPAQTPVTRTATTQGDFVPPAAG
jgi:hypothetical protein